MTLKTCPVCAHDAQSDFPCPLCGWEFPLLLGNGENTRQAYQSRLASSQQVWQQQHYNPDLEPALERDPFETLEEFSSRLNSRLWCVGIGVLQKQDYDIKSRRFPLKLMQAKPWTKILELESGTLHLTLDRENARNLYQLGAEWPLYAALVMKSGNLPQLRSLSLLSEHSILHAVDIDSPIISDRYWNNRDGTITDRKTNLMWMRPCIGQRFVDYKVVGSPSKMNWEMARQQTSGFAGYSDWRLPSIDELKTLVYCSTGKREPFGKNGVGGECLGDFQQPTIDLRAFPGTLLGSGAKGDVYFWSYSHYAMNASFAWDVNFRNGNAAFSLKNGKGMVRLVRVG